MQNNNKEAFQLLPASAAASDSDSSQVAEFALPPAPRTRRKVRRRARGRGSRDPSRSCCCGPSSGRGWPVGLAACLVVGWMMAISWVALVAHGDVANLDVKFKTGWQWPRMAPRVAKRMKKRRELDALVASGKAPASSYCSSDEGPDGGLLFDEVRPRRQKPRRSLRALRAGCGAFVFVGVLLAAAALTWLLADVRAQVAALRAHLDRVSSSCDGVSNDLFQCRSSSRQLQVNQTHLAAQIENITAFLANMSTRLNSVSEGLQEVQKRVQEAPQLMSIPKDMKDLSNNVADLGSQITEMKSTTKQLQLQTGAMSSNLTQLQNFVSEANVSLHNQQSSVANEEGKKAALAKEEEEQLKWSTEVADLTKNISQVNATMSNKLLWIQEDMNKHSKLIEALQDLGQNLSAKVTTLEGVSNEMAEKQKPVAHNIAAFNTQLAGATSQLSDFQTKVGQLQDQFHELQAKQETVLNRLDRLDAQPANPPSSTESVTTVSKSPAASALPSTATKAKDSP